MFKKKMKLAFFFYHGNTHLMPNSFEDVHGHNTTLSASNYTVSCCVAGSKKRVNREI